jgi:murein DD-endopeptidase MepM/ murein hydrolase activator NlpD
MSAIRYFIVLFIVIGALLCAGCSGPASDQNRVLVSSTPVPVTASVMCMSVPYAPIPVTSQEGENLAYELELVTAGNVTLVPEKVEVLDPVTNAVLYSAGEDVLAELYQPASVPPPTAEELMNGTGKLVYPRISIWFRVSPDNVPDRLVHRVTLNQSAEGLAPLTVAGGEVTVRKYLQPVVIGSPMQGPGWVAMETTSPFTHHFRGQISLNGVTRVPQRFAQDWIYIDPASGKVASGNVSLAKNFFGYGKEIYAVANGTVVDSLDGLPDIETIYSAPPVTIATAAGNYVILDIGNGKYACYAHMIPGSVRVKTGDVVKEGDVIGLMGNSGNSDLPHLHFQVVPDVPIFLGAEGYPLEYRSFDVIGKINETRVIEKLSLPGASVFTLWEDTSMIADFFETPVQQENSLPENYDIVRFP